MSSTVLSPLNTSQSPPTSFPFIFSIAPDTNLWLKPAPLDGPPLSLPLISHTQPTFYAPVPLASFIRATTTVSFVPEIQGDQAGLVLLSPRDESRWIKGGLEYVDGAAKRSVGVAMGQEHGADWGVAAPVSGTAGRVRAVVEFEREEEGTGTTLFVKVEGEVVREITWVFAASQDREEEIWIGFYGSRPAADVADGFEVQVEGWELIVRQED